MHPALNTLKKNLNTLVTHFKEEIKNIRTGQASPALLENLEVDAYGANMRLLELAAISLEAGGSLVISPFDPSVRQDIEKAILASPLGFTPRVQDTRIFVTVPSLNEEQRKKFIKLLGETAEEKKQILRNYRDDSRKTIRQEKEKKMLTEDDLFRIEKEIDILCQKTAEEIQKVREIKEKEIMTV